MDGAIQSATLLKNEEKALPLDGASAGTIAVIGPTAGLSKSDAVRQQLRPFFVIAIIIPGIDETNQRLMLCVY